MKSWSNFQNFSPYRKLIVAFQLFYLPMAFFIPPPLCLVHAQFNMLYQFWIHTEVLELSDVMLLKSKVILSNSLMPLLA